MDISLLLLQIPFTMRQKNNFEREDKMDKSFYIGNRQRFAASMRPGSIALLFAGRENLSAGIVRTVDDMESVMGKSL